MYLLGKADSSQIQAKRVVISSEWYNPTKNVVDGVIVRSTTLNQIVEVRMTDASLFSLFAAHFSNMKSAMEVELQKPADPDSIYLFLTEPSLVSATDSQGKNVSIFGGSFPSGVISIESAAPGGIVSTGFNEKYDTQFNFWLWIN